MLLGRACYTYKFIQMSFPYTEDLIENAFTYEAYRSGIKAALLKPPADEHERKMRPYVEKNSLLMDKYDQIFQVSPDLQLTVEKAPPAIWLVLTEGWCGDAAFNVPMLAAIEKAVPEKVKLRFLLRDSNLELMDAHLTDGGRSIPKLIVLSEDLQELGSWGPRPAALQSLMKTWKNQELSLKQIIPKVHDWYEHDKTQSMQGEILELVKTYS